MLKLILILAVLIGVPLALFLRLTPKGAPRRKATAFNRVAIGAALLLAFSQLMYLNWKAAPEAPGPVYWAFKVLNSIPAFMLGLAVAGLLRRFWYLRPAKTPPQQSAPE